MEKIIHVGNKEVKLKSTAGTMVRYRNNFNRDFIKDLLHLKSKIELKQGTGEELDAIDLEIFEKIAWSMAKTADDNIPDIEHWLDEFETFDIMIILPQIMDLLVSNMKQLKQTKETTERDRKKRNGKRSGEVNANTIILRCLKIGISLSEMDNITIGFVLDLIDENNSEMHEAEQPIEADADTLHRFFK